MEELLLPVGRQRRRDLGEDGRGRRRQRGIADVPHLGQSQGERFQFDAVEGLRRHRRVLDEAVPVTPFPVDEGTAGPEGVDVAIEGAQRDTRLGGQSGGRYR